MAVETAPKTEELAPELVDPQGAEEQELMAAMAAQDGDEPVEPGEEPTQEAAPEGAGETPTADPEVDPAPTGEGADPAGEGEEPKSRAWAAVTKAQKQVETDRQTLKAERHELTQLREESTVAKQQTVDLKEKYLADPLGTMQDLGLSFTELAKQVTLGKVGTAPTQTAPPTSEIAALREEVAALRQDRVTASEDAEVAEYRGALGAVLKGDEFALLSARSDAVDLMMKLSITHAKQFGEVLPPNVAAAKIQDEWRNELSSLGSHAAVREVLGNGNTPGVDPKSEPSSQPVEAQTTTLTNELSASPSKPKPALDDLDEENELLEAAKMIQDDDWAGMSEF